MQYEMGWNDTVGNIYMYRANQRKWFANQVLAGRVEVYLPTQQSGAYARGMKAAARTYLGGKPTPYRGPKRIIESMQRKVPQSQGTI